MGRLIGGFFPLRIAHTYVADSLFARWCPPDADTWLLHNGRSALNALWEETRPANVWLPAYICREVAGSVPGQSTIRYYPLDEMLRPRVAFLESRVKSKDHVLAVDYFGRPANAEFMTFVESRPDVGWVQDCAHALEGATQRWGDWTLYSPRKLIGVADGGILVANRKPLPVLAMRALQHMSFVLPSIERFEDSEESQNERWYESYVNVEANASIGRARMSGLSLLLLRETPASPDIEARRRNYEVLNQWLGTSAFFGTAKLTFAPLGFPIRTKAAKKVQESLSSHGIFAARHWSSLPSDPSEFVLEHQLAETLLTLPCDYRYDASDMQRVADTVLRVLNDHGG